MSNKPLKFGYRALHYMALAGILFNFIVYPAYAMVEHFPYGVRSTVYFPFARPLSSTSQEVMPESNVLEATSTAAHSTTARQPQRVVATSTVTTGRTARAVLEIHSPDKEGEIGYTNQSNSDDPSDNIFRFDVDKAELAGRSLKLSYEVYGIENASGVARSINEHTATGGYFVQKTTSWKTIEETVSADQLKQGANHILFTTFENQKLDYKVRNLKITAFAEEATRLVELADRDYALYMKDGQAYVKGVVLKSGSFLSINGQQVVVRHNEFEALLDNPHEINSLKLELKTAAGELLYKEEIPVYGLREVSDRVGYKRPEAVVGINKSEEGVYRFGLEGADLEIKPDAYAAADKITVQQLRNIDMAPMGTNIINVTKDRAAYRFLPEGAKFENKASLTLAYDKALLPKGYEEKDIQVMFFDLQQRRWLAVETDTLRIEEQKITGLTDHFTDYIAGIIQAPESPETSSYTPTSISDIKVADPTANIMQVQPPTANQKGDGTLEFPITIPAGRNGLQPSISLSYNNNGSSGMAGYGWDIAIPYISVDTKYGVPAYSTNQETESYLLNGEELLLKNGTNLYLPHRTTSPMSRLTGTVVFVPKVEGAFTRVERIGTSPQNYTWKVYDKSGTIYYYGQSSASWLYAPDAPKNIAKWYLSKVEDKNLNSIYYTYSSPTYSASNNLQGGREMRPMKIMYTSNPAALNGPSYHIDFGYDENRGDATFNYRYGFKEVNASLLRDIRVYSFKSVDGPQWVSDYEINYRLNYITGSFGKILLQSVTTTNKKNVVDGTPAGTESYTHTFEYHNDVQNGLFGNEQTISLADDLSGNKHSALSSTVEDYKGGEVNVGAGISPIANPPAWWPFSYGGTINFAFPFSSNTQSSPTMLLLDIDGDGLDDKVMKIGNEIKYRKNIGGIAFSQQLYKVYNLSDLGLFENKTKASPERSISIIAGNFNASKSSTTGRARSYFTDVNGDGLVDYIKDRIVYFNRMDPNSGLPTFTDNSDLTPNRITKAYDVDETVAPALPDTPLGNDLMDVVKVWVAPKDGTVDISGTITKPFVSSNNGIRYSVEKAKSNWNSATLLPDPFVPVVPWVPGSPSSVATVQPNASVYLVQPTLLVTATQSVSKTGVTVAKGDHLYFRVNSSQLPTDKVQVTWDPSVTYTTDNFDSANQYKQFSSSYSDAFLHGAIDKAPLTISEPGTYNVQWDAFTVNNSTTVSDLSDDVDIVLYGYQLQTSGGATTRIPITGYASIELARRTIKRNVSNAVASINQSFNLNSVVGSNPDTYRYFEIEVQTTSQINWKSLDNKFKPRLVKSGSSTTRYFAPQYQVYNTQLTGYYKSTFTASTTVNLNHNFSLASCTQATCGDQVIYLVVKNQNGKLVNTVNGLPAKFKYTVAANGTLSAKQQYNGTAFVALSGNNTQVTTGTGSLYFEYYANSSEVAGRLNTYQNSTNLVTTSTGGSPLSTGTSSGLYRANIFYYNNLGGIGTLYRNWGQFAYRGANPDQQFEFIRRGYVSKLALSGVSSTSAPTSQEISKMNDLMNMNLNNIDYDFTTDTFTGTGSVNLNQAQMDASLNFSMLSPDRGNTAWSLHERLYVKSGEMSPYLRYNTDAAEPPMPVIAAPTGVNMNGAIAIVKESVSESKSKGRSFSFFGLAVGTTESNGTSRQVGDFMDINGDGYPDIIGDKVQLTSQLGGLTNTFLNINLLGTTTTSGSGNSAGGSSAHIVALADPAGRFSRVKVGSSSTFSNLSIGGNTGKFETLSQPESVLVDLNGDGLADLVKGAGSVEFNTSKTFVPSSWSGYNAAGANKTTSRSLSANFGAGFTGFAEPLVAGMSFDGASSSNFDLSFGFSGSRSVTQSVNDFVDFNGDGLPDYINNGTVYFNTGTSHSPAMSLPRLSESSSSSFGPNVNASILIPISIPILGIVIKVGGGGGASWGKNFNEDNVSLRDFDGDGYVDIVESASETQLKVRYSKIGRTNMLKKVNNPTGSSIELDYATYNKISGTSFGSTYNMPFKKWVLSGVKVNDGFSGDGENTQQYAFEYQNGLKDRRERKFLGFGEVKTHQLQNDGKVYRTSVQQYLLNDMTAAERYAKGSAPESRKWQYIANFLKEERTYDGMQRLLGKKEYEYVIFSIGAGSTGNYNLDTTLPLFTYGELNRILPLVKRVKNTVRHYQGNSTTAIDHVTSELFRQYDQYGNVLSYTDETDNNNVLITYHYTNTLSKYLVNIPATHKVNVTDRYTTTGIDAKGNIISINRYKNGQSATGDVATTDMEYDALGNLTKVTLPKAQMSSGAATRMFYTYTYDDLFKQFVTEVNDAYGYKSKTTYTHFGMPLTQTDLNNVAFTYAYDPTRRVVRFKGPYHSNWTIQNEYKKAASSNLRYAITKHNLNDEAGGSGVGEQILYTSSFADGLGRIIQTKKQLDLKQACSGTSGYRFAVSGLQKYDEFGRVVESNLGQEELSCSGNFTTQLETYTSLPHVVQEKTSMVYDMQDRVVQNHVHGLNATTKYEYGFGNDTTSVNDHSFEKVTLPEGNVSLTYKDEKGRVRATKQVDGTTELLTTYWYTHLSELSEVIDAQGLSTKYEYDHFGQKTKTTHPDSGETRFTYDLTGKLWETVPQNLIPQNKKIVYNYSFNRLSSIVYPSYVVGSTTYPGHTVSYSYGANGAADYAAGRITQVTDLTGTKTLKYGKLGEVVEENRIINSQNTGQLYFKTGYRYDSWGRIMEMTYPDEEKVVYGYNNVGQLKYIVSDNGDVYLKDVKYNFFDQPTYIEYGNKVVTTNEYDLTQRIRAMKLNRPDTSTFMNNVYAYDRNQNITNITNNSSQHGVLHLGGTYSKNYEYDKFNRLKNASGHWQGGQNEVHDYNLQMAYNNTHGIQLKKQFHQVQSPAFTGQSENSYEATYTYDTARPHSVKSIKYAGIGGSQNATSNFTYDGNGNITRYQTNYGGFADRNMIWDQQNRLLAVVDDNTHVNHYIYDHAGERTLKSTGSVTQVNIGGSNIYSAADFGNYLVYPSGYVVVDMAKDEYSKHYYINGKRFMSRLEMEAGRFTGPMWKGEGVQAEPQTDGFDAAAATGIPNTVFGIADGNTEPDCNTQLIAIRNVYTANNSNPSASVQHCIDYINSLINSTTMTKCQALIEANKYICRPIDLNNPGNTPGNTTPPVLTPQQIEQFDCLTELNVLTAQYASALAQQNIQTLSIGLQTVDCDRITAGHCCQRYLQTGVWDCPECPKMTLEDCGILPPADQTDAWLNCMEDCMTTGSNPSYGQQCIDHFIATKGEWMTDCYFLTVECDHCLQYLIAPPKQETVDCMRGCQLPGAGLCVEYYDLDGRWSKSCNDLAKQCGCIREEPEEPGTGSPPRDTDLMNCARNCSNQAYSCWETYSVSGEWTQQCKQIMRDCGCYDPDDEQDCYRKALNYITKQLVMEPQSNACLVLEYVRTHFKCSRAIVEPQPPVVPPNTNDPWVGTPPNNNPGTDGPYDESKRKPIWWYHSDHLGSSTYLTDNFGRPTHYYDNLPFGETMVEHNQSTYNGGQYNNVYKFNGKELDAATGMYYYGARYYDPRISIFVSVDPLAEKYVGRSPYEYCFNNPINLIDPTGMSASGGPGGPPLKNLYVVLDYNRTGLNGLDAERDIIKFENMEKAGWKGIYAQNMIEANKLVAEYMGNQKVDNMVIETHGTSIYEGKPEKYIYADSNNLTLESIISTKNLQRGTIETKAFVSLINLVKPNGSLFLNVCSTGSDEALMNEIGKQTNNSFNIYYSNGDVNHFWGVRDGMEGTGIYNPEQLFDKQRLKDRGKKSNTDGKVEDIKELYIRKEGIRTD